MTHVATPVTRIAFLVRYAGYIQDLGTSPVPMLANCGIPEELLHHPSATICLKSAFKFGEMACKAVGTEHLGLYVGMQTSLADLGPAGEYLGGSTTAYDFLRRGMAVYDMLITGQRLWLSRHGKDVRLNITTIGEPSLGAYQSQLHTMAVITMNLRGALGKNWSPREIAFTYLSRENFPDNSCFEESEVVKRSETSYIVIRRADLGRLFPNRHIQSEPLPESVGMRQLPEDVSGLVQLQIEALLCQKTLHIDTVAESLMMPRRSMQRALSEEGTSFSTLLADTRMRLALNWLQRTDNSVADIAYSLGYTDPANFTRAFRISNGLSPHTFRQNLSRDNVF